LLHHLALVSESDRIAFEELAAVASALQKQVIRDVLPAWRLVATVSAFPTLEDVPCGHWPVLVVDDSSTADAGGVHVDGHGQPFAIVPATGDWSLIASHLTIEMVVDPSGNRLFTGESPLAGQGQVGFLLAACDPCAGGAAAYAIDGILVSDFVLPEYAAVTTAWGGRCSFTGAISRPRQVLVGGSLTWLDRVTRQLWQQSYVGEALESRPLTVGEHVRGSLREWVDARTRIPDAARADHERLDRLREQTERDRRCSASRAVALRGLFRELGRRMQ
jgi:hypothetical protein